MGLGAFTSVVGDAGKTVAHEADIAVTSGNSLTVAATLEAAKQAVLKMGAEDLKTGRAMIVGATGSIGAVCARLIAQALEAGKLFHIDLNDQAFGRPSGPRPGRLCDWPHWPRRLHAI